MAMDDTAIKTSVFCSHCLLFYARTQSRQSTEITSDLSVLGSLLEYLHVVTFVLLPYSPLSCPTYPASPSSHQPLLRKTFCSDTSPSPCVSSCTHPCQTPFPHSYARQSPFSIPCVASSFIHIYIYKALYSPSAFIYSSKFLLSTSRQVPRNLSTMVNDESCRDYSLRASPLYI